jgi:serine/threonine-protein phosphatase 2A regulatory subunit B'
MNAGASSGFSNPMLQAVANMVSANIFRVQEHRERTPMDDDEEPFLDVAWPHLQLVYEFLRLFIACKEIEPKAATKYLNSKFVAKLLELLEADDAREREAIKGVMQRYYSRYTHMRGAVRKALDNCCTKAAQELYETPYGVSELLELQTKVISGFSSPLKDEQYKLLQVLMPLHKASTYASFGHQLSECMSLFVQKDVKLCHDILKALLYYWPYAVGNKQVRFIEELEVLLDLMKAEDFPKLCDKVLHRIIACILCQNSQVAEKALELFNNSSFFKLVNSQRQKMFPGIISALYRNSTEHWALPVHGRTYDVLKLLMQADEHLFAEASAIHRRNSEDAGKVEERRERKWQVLRDLFDRKQRLAALAKPKPRPKVMGKAKAKAKAKVATGGHRQGAVMLPDPNCGLSVAIGEGCPDVDLQALIVDSRGHIVRMVSCDNYTAMNAAVIYSSWALAAPPNPPEGESVESVSSEGRPALIPGASIWITLPRLTAAVKQVLFLLVPRDPTTPRQDFLNPLAVRLVDGENGDKANFHLEADDLGGVAILGVIERPFNDDQWSFGRFTPPLINGTRTGGHFLDVLDLIHNCVCDVIPSAMKPQRVTLLLDQGSLCDMVNFLAPKRVFFGGGWDFHAHPDKRLAVDVAAVFFGAEGQELGAVSAESPAQFGAHHSGSGLLGAGVAFKFDHIAKEVDQIFLVANVSTPNMAWDVLQDASCRVVDHEGVPIFSYEIPECSSRKPGLILGRLCYDSNRRKWCFQAIGQFCGGHAWNDHEFMGETRSLMFKTLEDLRSELQDPISRPVESGGRLVASI